MPAKHAPELAQDVIPSFNPEERLYYYQSEVVRHFDGDTIGVQIDKGFGEKWEYSQQGKPYISIRFDRINSYEPNLRYKQTEEQKKLGKAASEFTKQELPIGTKVIIQSKSFGSFTRLDAEVFFKHNERGWLRYSDYLVEQGHAFYASY